MSVEKQLLNLAKNYKKVHQVWLTSNKDLKQEKDLFEKVENAEHELLSFILKNVELDTERNEIVVDNQTFKVGDKVHDIVQKEWFTITSVGSGVVRMVNAYNYPRTMTYDFFKDMVRQSPLNERK